MSPRAPRTRESGFTLPELIMAVTILGAIGATIGGVLIAAFSSTAGVQDRFDASRAAKQASLYWAPDVATVETVNPGDVCGSGATALITFLSTDHAPLSTDPLPPADGGTSRVTTWWLDDTDPAQVVRRTCAGAEAPEAEPRYPIAARIADRDAEVAGVATNAAEARGQATAECSDDGVAFRACGTDDPARVVRLSLRVPDAPAGRDPARPGTRRFQTYEFRVAGTREVQ